MAIPEISIPTIPVEPINYKILTINYSETSQSITDLTGTTWIINSSNCTTGYLIANVNFTAFNLTGNKFYIGYWLNTDDWIFEESSDEIGLQGSDWQDATNVELSLPFTIEFTGGTDATNAQLISWLEANATQQVAPQPSASISIGNLPIDKAYFGNNEISAIYFGNTKIYEAVSIPDNSILDVNGNLILASDGQLTTSVLYDISCTVLSGSSTGDTTVLSSKTATVTIMPDICFALPSSITVSGADYAYNSSTGEIVLSNATDDVSISATCPSTSHYLTFSSPNTFTLNVKDNQKYWDGTLYYSTDAQNWSTWGGTTTLNSSSSGTTKYLYLRGSNNTKITGASASSVYGCWVLTGSNISCSGNIENLLDYQTVENNQHPAMADDCYKYMFYNCTALTTVPALPATTLSSCCYNHMFSYCSSLTTAPALPATTLKSACYSNMFDHCSSLTTAPALPATILTQYCYEMMFYNCTSLTTPAVMAGGTTRAASAKECCYYMYYGCTSLNIYTSSTNHTPFYKSVTYSTSSSATDLKSSYRMFYQCYINGTKDYNDYKNANIQYYY